MSEWKNKKLRRSSRNNKIAGVCGGLGEYFGVDPTLVRAIFVVIALFGTSGIWLYILLAIIMPKADVDEDDIV